MTKVLTLSVGFPCSEVFLDSQLFEYDVDITFQPHSGDEHTPAGFQAAIHIFQQIQQTWKYIVLTPTLWSCCILYFACPACSSVETLTRWHSQIPPHQTDFPPENFDQPSEVLRAKCKMFYRQITKAVRLQKCRGTVNRFVQPCSSLQQHPMGQVDSCPSIKSQKYAMQQLKFFQLTCNEIRALLRARFQRESRPAAEVQHRLVTQPAQVGQTSVANHAMP